MSAQDVLNRLSAEFAAMVQNTTFLEELRSAESLRATFCNQMYPFRKDPKTIDRLMMSGGHARAFLGWLEDQLAPLGGVNLHSNKPIETLATNREYRETLRWLLHRTFETDSTVYQKVDLPWGQIPYFGQADSDRQIPKKIICTYYIEETLPIFNSGHLEYFISDHVLGLRPARDSRALTDFGIPYGDRLTVGQRWQVLCETLLEEKAKHRDLNKKSNVYFMRCLYNLVPPPAYGS